MELALREVIMDVCIGKILIQTNPETKEPNVRITNFPSIYAPVVL